MLGGIFVGGTSSRMNGVAKGLLRAPDGETIVEHVARAMREAGLEPVLVGKRAEYAALGLRELSATMTRSIPLMSLPPFCSWRRRSRRWAISPIASSRSRVRLGRVKKFCSAASIRSAG